MLLQRCFTNVETTSINVRRLNFHFQPNINVETALMNVDDQRCDIVKSKLMCLLGLYRRFTVLALTPSSFSKKTSIPFLGSPFTTFSTTLNFIKILYLSTTFQDHLFYTLLSVCLLDFLLQQQGSIYTYLKTSELPISYSLPMTSNFFLSQNPT